MTKTKHPKDRAERLKVKAKKKPIHSNASPVYRLLKEKEERDAASEGLPKHRSLHL